MLLLAIFQQQAIRLTMPMSLRLMAISTSGMAFSGMMSDKSLAPLALSVMLDLLAQLAHRVCRAILVQLARQVRKAIRV